MAPQWNCLRSLLFLVLLQLSLSIRIEDKPSNNSSSKVPAYRVSRPEPRQPVQRVPAHLQDIRPGFVDDDAGDVIRIIEPPQHFQQLKRLRQRQPQFTQSPHRAAPPVAPAAAAVVWEQPRKLSTNRGPKPPQHQQQRSKPAQNGDLLTQETQFSPQIANNLQLPVEILASVRKTERLLQRQRQKLPQVRQRHIQRQTHTVIAQKSLEQQRYQRGQQQRLRATLSQDQHKRSKRVKREAASYDVAQGLKLVAHIGELLKNATIYLPDELEPNELTPQSTTLPTSASQRCGNATKCDSRRRRQRLFKQQESRKTAVRGRNFRHEATTTTTATTTTEKTIKNTETSTLTTSATPLASRLVNSRKSPKITNHLPQQQLQPHQQHLQLSPRSDDSVLYADVMSNIRNLWQEHDHDHDLSATAPQFVAPAANLPNNTNYSALNVYLRELDEIAKKLPQAAPITGLNREEYSIATPTSTPSWYLINNEGKIYETRLDSETKPTAALFHNFPDMPKGKDPITTEDLE